MHTPPSISDITREEDEENDSFVSGLSGKLFCRLLGQGDAGFVVIKKLPIRPEVYYRGAFAY